MSQQKYADGEFTAEGIYGKGKSIIVKVQLAGDEIKHVEVTPHTTISRSLSLQKKFAAAVPEVVVGQPIDKVHLDKLAGSSLTTKGFNEALEKIKSQAGR